MATQLHGRLFDRFLLGDSSTSELGWELVHTTGLGRQPLGGERSGHQALDGQHQPTPSRLREGDAANSLLKIADIPTCPRMGTTGWFEERKR